MVRVLRCSRCKQQRGDVARMSVGGRSTELFCGSCFEAHTARKVEAERRRRLRDPRWAARGGA